MRVLAVCFLGAAAFAADPVPDEKAQEALSRFKVAFKTKEIEAKQMAVYELHDFPNDLVLKELAKLLRNRDPAVRNVAALAVGGQAHDPQAAGELLMKSYAKDFDEDDVISSVIDAMAELHYMGYWPEVQKALKDDRSGVVVRCFELIGANKDWRAFPDLVEMYKEVMPRRISWSTGSVSVDTGASGDADQQAAEAAFNAKYGRGGSKMKNKAKAKAKSFDLRNFSTQLRKCMKAITGEDFDNAFDVEDWWVENYELVARKIAEIEGKDPEEAAERAKVGKAELRAKVEEERLRIEEELRKQREAERGK